MYTHIHTHSCILTHTHSHILTHPHHQVSESIDRQDELVSCIESAHARFKHESAGAGASAREEMLKNLAGAYDVFQELLANLTEGTKVKSGVVCKEEIPAI